MSALLAAISLVLALVPALIVIRNLRVYRPLPAVNGEAARCSVLIPARNEAAKIRRTVLSILQNTGIEFEVLVLDDNSSDGTASIVRQIGQTDPRVRLVEGKPLPPGWAGKNFACQQLAASAQHPLLVFLDADVRIMRADALARLAQFVRQSGAALVSTVPLEETKTAGEKLIIPLIHFILLGFLPLRRMRATTDPRYAAACGQVMAVQRDAYERSGGHAAIADRLHDAMALARNFRERGQATDLFDGAGFFACRMYESASDVWRGFAKNATEGLASAKLILPSTALLLAGQVLPFLLFLTTTSRLTTTLAALGICAAWLPRLLAVERFRQSRLGALLHPVGIAGLVAIQWFAFARALCGGRPVWKGRDYLASVGT